MKRISILVPESAVIEAIADPRYIFSAANNFLAASGRPPLFEIEMVADKKEVQTMDGIATIKADKLLSDVEKTDLIIIPALFGDMGAAIEANYRAIPWIKKHYEKGTEVASLCVGAFLLASTGLLDGKKCSTHWAFENEFKKRFPKVELVGGGIITHEDRLYSSGGANSYWNLLIYLLEKYTDRETAILAAKYFAIDIDRESQAAFMMFNGQKDHEDETILEAQKYIEAHFSDKIGVEELSQQFAMSRRTFERRFKKATNNTVNEYIQRVRIEAGKRLLEKGGKNVSEIMFDIGYSDPKTFRNLFKKLVGMSPLEYRKKYQGNLLAVGF
ncbi:MAG: helix-turn-helix domain-containing protein [Saprospiraceae bacterium]